MEPRIDVHLLTLTRIFHETAADGETGMRNG